MDLNLEFEALHVGNHVLNVVHEWFQFLMLCILEYFVDLARNRHILLLNLGNLLQNCIYRLTVLLNGLC